MLRNLKTKIALVIVAYNIISNVYKLHYTPLTNNLFAADLSALVVDGKSTENVVYSPLSVHISLALMLTGAANHTEKEIRNVLRLGKEPKVNLIIKYGFFLNDTFKNEPYGSRLLVANRLFVNNKVKVLKKFSDIAAFYFKSQMENIYLSQPFRALERINDWVGQQTNYDTKDLSQSQTLTSNTHAVLANAIYFKPNWEFEFDAVDTEKRDFYISRSKKVPVDTMFTQFLFRYTELYTLNAKALELPYLYRNISMLIILPNEIDGLEKLEKNLKGIDLNSITAQMTLENVDVYLPKFRIESEVDLMEPLRKMGSSLIFENANFSNMFDTSNGPKLLNIKQKTIIECNEKGVGNANRPSDITTRKYFRAAHPFVFIIRTKTMVLFYGHLAKF